MAAMTPSSCDTKASASMRQSGRRVSASIHTANTALEGTALADKAVAQRGHLVALLRLGQIEARLALTTLTARVCQLPRR